LGFASISPQVIWNKQQGFTVECISGDYLDSIEVRFAEGVYEAVWGNRQVEDVQPGIINIFQAVYQGTSSNGDLSTGSGNLWVGSSNI
jgi:hypothetical protein